MTAPQDDGAPSIAHPEAQHFDVKLQKRSVTSTAKPAPEAGDAASDKIEHVSEQNVKTDISSAITGQPESAGSNVQHNQKDSALEAAALQYMEAIMGKAAGREFMDAPQDDGVDAEAEAAAAVAFLEDLWDIADVEPEHQQPTGSKYATSSSNFVPYGELAASFASAAFVGTRPGRQPEAEASKAQDKQLLTTVEERVQQKQQEWTVQRNLAAAAKIEVAELEEQVASIRQELSELEQSKPPAPNRMSNLQRWLADKEPYLLQQQLIATKRVEEAAKAEASLRGAELERDKYSPINVAAQLSSAIEKDERLLHANEVSKKEERAVHGYKVMHQKRQQQADNALLGQSVANDAQVAAARAGQQAAVQRLKTAQAALQETRRQLQADADACWDRRAAALLQLKASLREVYSGMQDHVSLYRKRIKARKLQQKAEFQELLEAGQNPYEVARRRDAEASVRSQKRACAAKLRAGTEAIARKLIQEDLAWQKQLDAREAQRAYEEAFQQEMGPANRDRKLEQYMRKTTRAKADILDPTGRMPAAPSEVTVSKTWAFGLGKADPSVTEKIQAMHEDKEQPLVNALIPKALRILATQRAEQAPGAHYDDLGGDAPSRVSKIDKAENFAQPEFEGTWEIAETEVNAKPHMLRLSKLEQKAMEQSQSRHKASITQPQMFAGKELKGPAFIATPAVVVFRDFEPGQTYKQKVTLTNASFGKCTFRVMPLPEELSLLFDVHYKPPGSISAGMTCDIWITFKPVENNDIFTSIPLLAATGPILVPLECYTKKASLSISSRVADFTEQTVSLGDKSSQWLTVTNDGALEVDYLVTVLDLEARECSIHDGRMSSATVAVTEAEEMKFFEDKHKNLIEAGPFTLYASHGRIPTYGKANVKIEFAPVNIGQRDVLFSMAFKAPQQPQLLLDTRQIAAKGHGSSVPITVESALVDFHCCSFDQVYRNQLVVKNDSRIAAKASITTKPELTAFLEFAPSFAFVQAGTEYSFQVTLRPSRGMLDACAQFVKDRRAGIVEIPLKVNVAGQALPLHFVVRAQLTSSDLVFSPSVLDFGKCTLSECTAVPITIRNTSALPQSYGFLDLPEEVSIEPNCGFGTLLPGDMCTRHVAFQATVQGTHMFQLRCSTLAQRVFTIPARADVVESPVSFCHNRMQLAATPLGTCTTASTLIRNTLPTARRFEFAVPADSGLIVTPRSGTVPGAGSVRIQVDFAPRPEKDSSGANPYESARAMAGNAARQSEIDDGSSPGQALQTDIDNARGADAAQPGHACRWRQVQSWQLPCYVQAVAADAAARVPGALHLCVETCAVEPYIVLEGEQFDWQRHRYTHDFGSVPAGSSAVGSIRVRNVWYKPLQLSLDALNPLGPFEQVNAARRIEPGQETVLKLRFSPTGAGEQLDVVTLRVPGHTLCLAVKGCGVLPKLAIEPELPEGLDLGDVAVDSRAERSVMLVNNHTFELCFSCALRGLSQRSDARGPVFYVNPEQGTIQPGGRATVTLVFQPDHQAPYFDDQLDILIPGQLVANTIAVHGRGWSEGLFFKGARYGSLLQASAPGRGLHPSPDASPAVRELDLTFPEHVRLGETKCAKLEVCSLKSDAGGAAAEVIFKPLSDEAQMAGWSIDAAKINVGAGESKHLMVRFEQPSEADVASAASHGVPGYVSTVLEAVGKGGLPAPVNGREREYRIRARVWVDPVQAPDQELKAQTTATNRKKKK